MMPRKTNDETQQYTSWRRDTFLLFLLVWILLTGLFVASLDGRYNNMLRLAYACAFPLVAAVRWKIRFVRREDNHLWLLYGLLMLAGPVTASVFL